MKFFPKTSSSTKGSITIELLIAFMVLVLATSAVIIVVFGNQSVSVDTQTNSEALYRAQAMLEQARAQSRQDFASVVSKSSVTEQSGSISYTKKLDVADIDIFTKQATSTITWQTGTRSFSIVLSTILTNPQLALGGDTCSPILSGDWTRPEHSEFPSADLISPATGNHSNGLAISDVEVVGSRLYLTAISTDNFKNTFYIFNLPADTTQMPVYLGSVDNAPMTDEGLNAVTAVGRYAYVANGHEVDFATCTDNGGTNKSCGQLQIIDVGDSSLPASPDPITYTMKIPGVTGSSGQGVGLSVFYNKRYVFLGLASTTGSEFNIIDVGGGSGSPTHPIWVGGYDVGSSVNSIYVKDTYAYLATSETVSGNKQLLVLDISDKTNPHLSTSPVGGFFSTPGFGVGHSVQVVGNEVYLGRAFSGASVPNLYVLDSTNPATYPDPLPFLGSKVIGTNDGVNGLTIRADLAFLWTNTAFQIWKVSSSTNPYTFASWANIPMADFLTSGNPANASGTSLDCSGNYFYVALTSPQGQNKDIFSVITPSTSFYYDMSASPAGKVLDQGSSYTETVTVTKTAGTAESVSVTLSGFQNNVSATPVTGSCTPNPACSVDFLITAASNAQKVTKTITATGVPLNRTTTSQLTIQ